MTSKWGKAYWTDLGERVASTAVQTLIPMYIAAANITQIDWLNVAEVVAGAAGLSLLKGLAVNLRSTADGTASMVGVTSNQEVQDTPPAVGSDETSLGPVETDEVASSVDNDDRDSDEEVGAPLPDDAQPADEDDTPLAPTSPAATQEPAAPGSAATPTTTPEPTAPAASAPAPPQAQP
jgi:hypothetical protein